MFFITSSGIVHKNVTVIEANITRKIFLISSGIVHEDAIMIISTTSHSQYDKYQNNQNNSTDLAQMKGNMNYKHSHNSLTNIHIPCMKNMSDMKAFVIR